MSFYTYVKANLEISGISRKALHDKLDDVHDELERDWNRIATLIAMPPMDQKDSDGYVIHWADYIAGELAELKECIEDNLRLEKMLEIAIDAQSNDPNSVHDDNDKWDEEKQEWVPLTIEDLK